MAVRSAYTATTTESPFPSPSPSPSSSSSANNLASEDYNTSSVMSAEGELYTPHQREYSGLIIDDHNTGFLKQSMNTADHSNPAHAQMAAASIPSCSSSNMIDLPPGFRFHPSDEELITYYLAQKILDPADFMTPAVTDADLNKSEPWELPGKIKEISKNKKPCKIVTICNCTEILKGEKQRIKCLQCVW